MKSQSLEVLSEIRKTLSVLSIQIEKLSAALEELEVAEEDIVPAPAIAVDAGFSSEPEAAPQEESQAEDSEIEVVAEGEETFESATAVLESEESLETTDVEEIVSAGDTEEILEISEEAVSADNSEEVLEVTETEGPLEEAVPAQELEDLPEAEAVDLPEDLPESVLDFDPLPADASGDLPQEPLDLSQEPVDLSQDIEDEMKLPDVQGFQWMIDIPGSKVANVISAISLNDRVLLINTLFKENPELFQQTISKFNSMESLSEAISYVLVTFPEWNLNSDVVYRLMMAVRRRLG